VSSRTVGILAAAGAAILFGTATVATGFALRSFDPLSAGAWRAAFGAAVFVPLVLLRRSTGARGPVPETPPGPGDPPPRSRASTGDLVARVLVLGVLGGPAFLVALNLAVQRAGAALSGMAVGMYALLAVLLGAPLLSERVRPAALGGFVVAVVGTALLTGIAEGGTATSVDGVAIGLLAALSYAGYLVLARRWSQRHGLRAETITLGSVVTATVVLFALVVATDPASFWPAGVTPTAVAALAWLAFVLAAGQLLVVAGVQRLDARTSSTLLLLNPLTTALLAPALLGERLSAGQLVGAGLVLAGMAVAVRSR
jgi:probable blue pigment (indigoidine) exporter